MRDLPKRLYKSPGEAEHDKQLARKSNVNYPANNIVVVTTGNDGVGKFVYINAIVTENGGNYKGNEPQTRINPNVLYFAGRKKAYKIGQKVVVFGHFFNVFWRFSDIKTIALGNVT